MRILAAAAAIICLFPFAGCSTPAQVAATPNPLTSPTPSKSLPESYGSVVELRDAAKAAGYSCVSWVQENDVKLAAESGNCRDSDVFMTFLSRDDVDILVTNLKKYPPNNLLVGPNWVINTEDDLGKLQKALGGTIVRN